MNELDQFVKHVLQVKNYARYTDDFVILANNREYLETLIPKIENFLKTRLALSLHPNKVSIRSYRQGVDFLGYVLSHADAHEINEDLTNQFWFWMNE